MGPAVDGEGRIKLRRCSDVIPNLAVVAAQVVDDPAFDLAQGFGPRQRLALHQVAIHLRVPFEDLGMRFNMFGNFVGGHAARLKNAFFAARLPARVTTFLQQDVSEGENNSLL